MTTTQTIGVVGAGIMGTGIAQACVVSGLNVVLIDLDEQRVTRGRDAIDVVRAVMQVFSRDFDDPKYRLAPLLEQMAAAGHLGRKSGRGFYTYEERHRS